MKGKKRAIVTAAMLVTFLSQTGFTPLNKIKPEILTNHVDLLYGTQLTSDMLDIYDASSALTSKEEDKELTVSIGDFDPYGTGEQQVKIKATNHNGETAEKTITANVIDMTPPEFLNMETEKGHVVAEVGGTEDISNYIKVNDNADGDISKLIKTNKKLDTSKPGTEKIKCQVSDMSGNTSSKKFTFDIVDTTAPTIEMEDDNVEYGTEFNLKDHVKVKDNCDKSDDIKLKSTKLNTHKYGTQKITVTATDKAGNTAKEKFAISVTDSKAPVMKLNGTSAAVTVGEKFNPKDMLESVKDERDGDMMNDVEIKSNVDTSKEGTYKVSYSVTDSAGNSVTKTIQVIVRPEYGLGIVNTAMTKVGSPYVFGASGPFSFDCSGFAQWVYAKNGKSLPRTAAAQFAATSRTESPQKGDLVFFKNTYKPGISHVGIYIGNGQMVEAANKKLGVKVSSLSSPYYKRHFAGYGVY